MDATSQPRWFSVRKWEVAWGRLQAPVWLATIALMLISAVRGWGLSRQDAVVVSALLLAMAAVGLRFLRSMTLGLALLPDAIMVSRALSAGRERIPVKDIGSATYVGMWQGDTITIYRRNRLLPPVVLYTSFMSGYSADDWELLRDSLRQLLAPLGKWKEAPWWHPWFPI